MDCRIKDVKAREVLDSRGNPTVEVDVTTDYGLSRATVPSGASTGIHEALELRDKGKRLFGLGVLKAVNNVNSIISKKIIGLECTDQRHIDNLMIKLDNTENKRRLGANAILGVSIAACRAAALCRNEPLYRHIGHLGRNKRFILPVPCMNIVNGGAHADNNLDIQEFIIMPTGAKTFKEAMQMGSEIYHTLKTIIHNKYGKNVTNVGDEGGFAPPLNKSAEALDIIMKSIEKAGYIGKVKLALDCAASEFYKNGSYIFEGKKMKAEKLMGCYAKLIDEYPIASIEDPFSQDDFKAWAMFTGEFGKKVQIVGDDLLVTSVKRIKEAINRNACNALLLKINQIGTITESISAWRTAVSEGWKVMVSHRSGETGDSFISDLAVGLGAGQIKAGAPCRSERLAKYNQLIRIEEESGRNAKYASGVV